MRRVGQAARSALVVLLLLAACGPARRGGAGELRDLEQVSVVVENQNFYQATIYARVNSARVRLGEVNGNSTATLTAPRPVGGQMSVEVRLLAVGAYTSYPVSVAPGDEVRVIVPPNLHRYRGAPR